MQVKDQVNLFTETEIQVLHYGKLNKYQEVQFLWTFDNTRLIKQVVFRMIDGKGLVVDQTQNGLIM